MEAEGGPARRITATHRAHLRYQGTDTAVIVGVGSLADMTAAFEAEYSRRFSFLMRDKPVIVEAVSVEVTGAQEEYQTVTTRPVRTEDHNGRPARRASACSPAGRWAEVDLFPRAGLRPGHAVDGPAIITEELATTVVEPGWQAVVTGRGDLLLSRVTARPAGRKSAPKRTRSCWRSSTTCSCRWPSRWACGCSPPRTRSTSRSGSTSPARSSTPTAA